LSVTTMLRATKPQDEWYTPAYAVKPLLPYLKPHSYICCPFDLPISKFYSVFKEADHLVAISHKDLPKGDFFQISRSDVAHADYIISNPPYSLKDDVFEHLFKLGRPFAMLMGATAGLFEGKRFDLFENKKLEVMWLKPRVAYIRPDGEVVKSPPFQSCYVCHRVLPKAHMFARVVRE